MKARALVLFCCFLIVATMIKRSCAFSGPFNLGKRRLEKHEMVKVWIQHTILFYTNTEDVQMAQSIYIHLVLWFYDMVFIVLGLVLGFLWLIILVIIR